jgi:heat shock protein HtpX
VGLSARMALTAVLLALLYLPLVVWVAGAVWVISSSVLLAAVVVAGAAAFALLAPSVSERVALRTARAREVAADTHPQLAGLVGRLAAMADVAPPRVAVAAQDVPNAFTVGRRPAGAVIVVTEGLLDRLDERELEAVLAHELAHVVHRDAFVMTVAAAPALLVRRFVWGVAALPFRARNAVTTLAALVLLLYLLPLLVLGWFAYSLAVLLVMALSRYREHVADRVAGLLTGTPEQLMSALQRIEGELAEIPERDLRQVSALNAFCVVPAGYRPGTFEVDPVRVFPTHPPLDERLARLGELSRTMARPLDAGAVAGAPRGAVVARRDRPRNPHASLSLGLAALVWLLLGWAWVARPDTDDEALVWLPLLATTALVGGVLLGLQGVGRASAGASGMGLAATALALLLGPPVIGFVAMAAYLTVTAT